MLLQQRDDESQPIRKDQYKYQSSRFDFEKTEYLIYSTVLGKLLTEVDSSGRKTRTFVYGGGQVVATQNIARSGTTETKTVKWEHRDASNASYATSAANGGMSYLGDGGQAELDPLNSNVGTSNPFDQGGENLLAAPGSGWGYPGFGDAFGGGGSSCYVDWMPQPCGFAMQVLNQGGGVIYNGPQFRHGESGWQEFRAFADGTSGYGHWEETSTCIDGECDSQRDWHWDQQNRQMQFYWNIVPTANTATPRMVT